MNDQEFLELEGLTFGRPQSPLKQSPSHSWASVPQSMDATTSYHPYGNVTVDDTNLSPHEGGIVYNPTSESGRNTVTGFYQVPETLLQPCPAYFPEMDRTLQFNNPLPALLGHLEQPSSSVPLRSVTNSYPDIYGIHVPVVPSPAFQVPTPSGGQQTEPCLDGQLLHPTEYDSNAIQQGVRGLSISTQSLNGETNSVGPAPNSTMMGGTRQEELGICDTGSPAGPVDPWEKIRRKFFQLYIEERKTLEAAMLVLKNVHGFHASVDQFKRKVKIWPECRKNKRRGEPRVQASALLGRVTKPGKNGRPRRTRPKRAMARLRQRPVEEGMSCPQMVSAVPDAPPNYTVQEALAISLKSYIQGFFDAAATTSQVLGEQYKTEWRWKTLYTRCQAISMIAQKSHIAIHRPPSGEPTLTHKAQALTNRLRSDNIVRGMIKSRILDEFAETPSSPYMLLNFWNLCRALRGIAIRIWGTYANDQLYILDCAAALRAAFIHITDDHRAGLMKVLEYFVRVPPLQTKDALEMLCKCTAEVLSTRLDETHPLALQAYADYHRYWNERGIGGEAKKDLLERYRKSLEKSEAEFGLHDDRTLQILNNYATAACHIGQDNNLTTELGMVMWDRTQQRRRQQQQDRHGQAPGIAQALTGESEDGGGAWTTNTQCMVDAASLLGLVCSTYHENLRKTQTEMRRLKKDMGCNPRTKNGRRKWRGIFTMPDPPSSVEVNYIAALLRQTIEAVDGHWSWDGVIAGTSLSGQLGRLENGTWRPRGCTEYESSHENTMKPPRGRQTNRKKGSYHDKANPWVAFALDEVSCAELMNTGP